MQTHLWTWNYTCVISPWESAKIKTKTISCSVFSSQILQNPEINIVLHWNFWRKYGSVSHLFSCIWEIRVQNLASHAFNSKITSAQKICNWFFLYSILADMLLCRHYFVLILKDKNLRKIELQVILFRSIVQFFTQIYMNCFVSS